ncbi:hypothetical protein C2R22_13785 [Salinigranum rubrum]|uniref:Uncharacterized protein n=1 Tax=Salinigranum rubrum TaxID=755307 RepID=A0A2I8VKW5_9EURY|nr:hypothetical protein [Salinigranum rubrum]AUV82577.1 hypothetical protein C2R22_13785 [Salinigranum rubrum]
MSTVYVHGPGCASPPTAAISANHGRGVIGNGSSEAVIERLERGSDCPDESGLPCVGTAWTVDRFESVGFRRTRT